MPGFSRHRAFASAVEVWQKQLADVPLPLPAGTGAPAALQEFVQRSPLTAVKKEKKKKRLNGPCIVPSSDDVHRTIKSWTHSSGSLWLLMQIANIPFFTRQEHEYHRRCESVTNWVFSAPCPTHEIRSQNYLDSWVEKKKKKKKKKKTGIRADTNFFDESTHMSAMVGPRPNFFKSRAIRQGIFFFCCQLSPTEGFFRRQAPTPYILHM